MWCVDAPVGFAPSEPAELAVRVDQIAMAWNVHGCWPSEYTAVADLDANANAVAIRSSTPLNEGERVASIPAPDESGSDEPA